MSDKEDHSSDEFELEDEEEENLEAATTRKQTNPAPVSQQVGVNISTKLI